MAETMTSAAADELAAALEARCRRLGVPVHHAAPGDQGMVDAVLAVARSAEARQVIVADDLGAGRDALVAALEAAGIALNPAATPRAGDAADLGVSRAAFAVAETGSLGVLGNGLQPRMATMLPPIHVALVDRSRILRSLDDAAAEMERLMRPGPGALQSAALVTGPSRTADVEKTLALGVHGPREVHVILTGAA